MADSTVIVQHVCSVAIFVCCFVGIYQERISPVSVVGWGSTATIIGWLLWDIWIGQDEPQKKQQEAGQYQGNDGESYAGDNASMGSAFGSTHDVGKGQSQGLGLTLSPPQAVHHHGITPVIPVRYLCIRRLLLPHQLGR